MTENSTQISHARAEELYKDAMLQITNSFCGVKFEDDSGSDGNSCSDDSSNSDENSDSEYNSESDEDLDLAENKHYCSIGKIIKFSKTSMEFCTVLIECNSGSRIKLGTFVLLPYLASGVFRNTFSWIGHVIKTAGRNGDINTLEVRVPSHRFRCLENINIGDKVYYEHLKECYLPLVEIPEGGIEVGETAEFGFHVGSAVRISVSIKPSDRKILDRLTKPLHGTSFRETNGFQRHYCPLGQVVKLTKISSESIILVEGSISPRNVFCHGNLQVFNITSEISKKSFSSVGKVHSYSEKIYGWEFEIKVQSDNFVEKIKIGDTIYHVHYWECHVPVIKIPRGGIRIQNVAQITAAQVVPDLGLSENSESRETPSGIAEPQVDSQAEMGTSQEDTSEPEFLNGILTKKEIKMASAISQVRLQVLDVTKSLFPEKSEDPKETGNPAENRGTQVVSWEGSSKDPENTKNPNEDIGSQVDFQTETDSSKEGKSEPKFLNGFSTKNEIKANSDAPSSIQRGIPRACQLFKYSLSLLFSILMFYSFYCIFMFYYVYYILWLDLKIDAN